MEKCKFYWIFCLLFLGSFYWIACSDDKDPIKPELVVSKEEMTFGKEGGEQKLAVESNLSWTISSSETWCTLSMTSGEPGTKQFLVIVAKNTDVNSREAILTVVSGSMIKTVKVNQAHSDLLSVVKNQYDVDAAGETITVEMQVSAEPKVVISNAWIQEEPVSYATVSKTRKFIVSPNPSHLKKEGHITFTIGDLEETIIINQKGVDLNLPADKTGMEHDALALAKKITLGWNLGNSLEAYNNSVPSETAWGNPATNQAMINMVKAAGFNAIRIPCAWNGYIVDETNYRVSDAWFARVKEIVDYCMNNDMYVILNIHWDGGWLENNPTYDKQKGVNTKQKALWEQIAVHFRGYDEHLLFAGTNEVHVDYGTPSAENIEVQLSYNQTFVDAVRSTGGRNTWRNLIVQSYNTNIDLAVGSLKPATDPTANRMMVEVHYYDPYDFCIEENSNKFLWGSMYASSNNVSTWGQEDYVTATFNKMKTHFVDLGYPVILGEYSPTRRTTLTGNNLVKHNEARTYYLKYVTKQAKDNGMVPFYWDNGATGNLSSGLFNRNTLMVADQAAIDALVEGSAAGVYPF